MGEILDGIQGIYDTIVNFNGYTFFQELIAEAILWFAAWYVYMKIAAIKFFWGVAQAMLDTLDISTLIQTYWGQLDSSLLGFMTRYKIPEAINLIMSSHIVAFLVRLI